MTKAKITEVLKTAYDTAAFPKMFFVNFDADEFIKINHLEGASLEDVENAVEDLKNELENA